MDLVQRIVLIVLKSRCRRTIKNMITGFFMEEYRRAQTGGKRQKLKERVCFKTALPMASVGLGNIPQNPASLWYYM